MNKTFQEQIEEMSNEIKQHLHLDEDGRVIETPRNEFSSNINAIRIYLEEIVKSNPDLDDYAPKYANEIIENMRTVLELSRFIDSEAIRNSQKKEDAIVAEVSEQMKRYQKLKNAYVFVALDSEQLIYFKHKMIDKGIPFNELISSNSNKCLIVANGAYANEIKLCARSACASSRSGQVSLGTMQNESTFEISGLSPVEKGFYETYIRDRNLEFAAKEDKGSVNQLSYASALTTNEPTNMKYSVVFRREDSAEHLKAVIMATAASEYLLAKKGNAYLANIIMSNERDKIAIEGAVEKSAYSDVYLCADSADMFIKLTQTGLEVYSRGANDDDVSLQQTVSKNDKDFYEIFNANLNKLKSCGVKVILDAERTMMTKNGRETFDMHKKEDRKKLLSSIKTKRLSGPTYDENFIKQLKSPALKDFKTKTALIEAQKDFSKTDLFNNVVFGLIVNGYIDRQSELLANDPKAMPLDIVFNKRNKIDLITLTDSYAEYAKQYANFMEIKQKREMYEKDPNKFHEIYKGEGVPTAKASDEALTKLTLMGESLKQEIKTFQAEYNIPDTDIDSFKASLATMCGATYDPRSEELIFSNNLSEVEKSCAALEVAKDKICSTYQKIETRIPTNTYSLEQKISHHKTNMREAGIDEMNRRENDARILE